MSAKRLNIAVFLSGGGSNLQSLIDAQRENYFKSSIELVISNKKDAFGLQRAKMEGIDNYYIEDEEEVIEMLREYNIDLICLAGYLKILSKKFLNQFEGKIINIHPSLLPKYGGKGMYGLYVHEAVLDSGDQISGATVHFVTEKIDMGKIIIQEEIDIKNEKTAIDIGKKVLKIEHKIYKEAIRMIEEGEI
ncbi:MAG: phosphoribosylglycinamide formyltransferase [Tissierellia bacterium]|nr:phosphoribosylglycinamide formyltransferase [Tissierellia bacterium]